METRIIFESQRIEIGHRVEQMLKETDRRDDGTPVSLVEGAAKDEGVTELGEVRERLERSEKSNRNGIDAVAVS